MLWAMIAILFFTGIVGVYNVQLYEHYCHHTYDLGIFLEAFKKFSLTDWDPYLSVRQVTILQDHWEPILVLISPLAKFFNLAHFGFGVEIGFFILAALAIHISTSGQSSAKRDLGFCLLILFLINRDSFEAAFYPIHPTTWAVFPLIVAGLFIPTMMPSELGGASSLQRESVFKTIVRLFFLVVLLNLFNEQYSLSALGLVLAALIFTPGRVAALAVLPLSAFLTWWALKGRSLIVGELFERTGRIKLNLSDIISLYSWDLAQGRTVIFFILGFAPLLWFFILSARHWNQQTFKRVGLWVGLFSPLIMGRLLSNSFGLHYNAILVAAMITLLYLTIDVRVWPKRSIAGLVFFCAVLFTVGKWKKAYYAYTEILVPNCVHIPLEPKKTYKEQMTMRKERIDYFYEKLKQEPESTKVIALGNLVPNILSIPQIDVFHLGAFEVKNTDFFDWILVERGAFGNQTGVPPEKLEGLIHKLKTTIKPLQILADDSHLFVAKGLLPKSLFRNFFYTQSYKGL